MPGGTFTAARAIPTLAVFFGVASVVSAMSRVAVVTGANKGIGLEIIRKLAQTPGHICILTSRDEVRGLTAASTLKEEGLEVVYKQLDLNYHVSVERFVSEVEREYGRCDILVNNAAVLFTDPNPTPFKAQAEPTLKTNFFDTVSFTEAMLPLVRKSPAGRIVNLSTGLAHLSRLKTDELRDFFTDPSLTTVELSAMMRKFIDDVMAGRHESEGWPNSCYITSKLAVIAYSNVLAMAEKEAGTGVIVNSCCPGYCATDMTFHKGYLTAEEGARTPFMLTQPAGIGDDPLATGKFFKREALVEW